MNPAGGPGAFGPYRILHQIGVGVLGPVFRAYNPSDDRPWVIKVLRVGVTPQQAAELVEALKRPTGPGALPPAVVLPEAVGVEGGTPWLVQEYIASAPLDVAAQRAGEDGPQRALALLEALAETLDAAHGRGLLHGALHPRDIFVEDDSLRVTGFGVAPALERVGLRAPVRRPYSAPEVAAGESWGPAADRFAFAALAYELLTGRRPAGAGAQTAACFRGPAGDADPEALLAAFAAALAPAPKDRPASARRFLKGLGGPLRKPAAKPAAAADGPQTDAGTAQPSAADAADVANVAIDAADARLPAAPAPDPPADASLPPAPPSVAETTRSWWRAPAIALLAGLLLVSAAASYVIGVRLGGGPEPLEAGAGAAHASPPAAPMPAPPPSPAPAPPPEPAPAPAPVAAPALPAEPETAPAPLNESVAAPSADPAPPAPEPAPPPAPVEEGSGWLLVRTAPPGAGVRFGGEDHGQTPLSIGDVPFGSIEVVVSRDGFRTEVRRVVLSAAEPVAAIGIDLTPLAAAAAREAGGAR